MDIRKYFQHKHSEMDLTKGNLFWKFPLFALPLALTTVLQLLFSTVDLYTVSKYGGGSVSMSAVGSNTSLINLIVTVFVNLSMGANVAISQAKGANNKDKAEKVLHTSIIVSLIAGILVGLTGFFLSGILLKRMNTPDSIIDSATNYLKIYFCGLPFLMIYNYGSQILRALGDSRKPLYILAIAGIVNVGLDFILVKYAYMDVIGVAVATISSEAVAAILIMLVLIFNKSSYVHFSFKKFKIDGESLKDILIIGLPAGIQGLAFSIPNVMIQSSLYSITNYTINGVSISQDEIVSGSSAANQLENFAFAIEDAIGVSLCTFVGQNYGALKKENIRKLFWYAISWCAITCAAIAVLYLCLSNQLLSLFITEKQGVIQANAIAAGKQRMYIMTIPYVFDGIMVICGDYLRGMKISTPPAIITLIGCTGLRILFLYTLFPLDYFHTIFWLFAAYPISWIIIDIVYIPVVILLERKVFKKMDTMIKDRELNEIKEDI